MNTCNRGIELSPSDDVTRLTPRKDGEQHAWGLGHTLGHKASESSVSCKPADYKLVIPMRPWE
jgi:hypothetical protein